MERSNCPNCGAPAVGKACAYCGTPFARPEEVMSLAIGRTVSVSFEHEGRLYEFDMRLENVDVEANADPTVLYADDYMYKTFFGNPEYEATLRGSLVKSARHGHEALWFASELSPNERTR